jgi:hypothetical protein
MVASIAKKGRFMTTENQLAPLEIPAGTLPGVANALRHWHEHRPRMYTQLYAQGNLLEMATAAYEATVDDTDALRAELVQTQQYDEPTAFTLAQQIVRERYIYLPTEEDVPELMQTDSGIYIFQPEQGD